MYPICRHAVYRRYGTQCQRIRIRTFVVRYSYAFYRQQHGSGLPDFVVQSVFAEQPNEKAVCLP